MSQKQRPRLIHWACFRDTQCIALLYRRASVKRGPADLRTGERVNCGPYLWTGSAYYPRALPVATARLPGGGLLPCGPRIHTFHGSPSLPPSTAFHPSLPLPLPPLCISSPSLTVTLEVGPLNTARGLGERCMWGVGH